jgi:hypothetical protein
MGKWVNNLKEYRISNKEFRIMKLKTLGPCLMHAGIRDAGWITGLIPDYDIRGQAV